MAILNPGQALGQPDMRWVCKSTPIGDTICAQVPVGQVADHLNALGWNLLIEWPGPSQPGNQMKPDGGIILL